MRPPALAATGFFHPALRQRRPFAGHGVRHPANKGRLSTATARLKIFSPEPFNPVAVANNEVYRQPEGSQGRIWQKSTVMHLIGVFSTYRNNPFPVAR